MQLSKNPRYSINNHWLNILLLKKNKKNKVMNLLNKKNIQARPVWYPNHLQKMYKKYQTYKIQKSISKLGKHPMAWFANQNLGMHYNENMDYYNAIRYLEATLSLPEPDPETLEKSLAPSSKSPSDDVMSTLVNAYTKIIIQNISLF